MNPLYARPTGYGATMVGFPYDDVKSWCGAYPADVFVQQFAKVADGWQAGLPALAEAVTKAPPERRADAEAELRFAETCYLHFQSVVDQTRFTVARDAQLAKDKPPTAEQRRALVAEMRDAAQREIATARRQFTLAQQDSRIAFEASNHYYYVPLDLAEKVLNCRQILHSVLAGEPGTTSR